MENILLEESESKRVDEHSDSDEDNTIEVRNIPEDEKSLARLTGAQKEITFKVQGTIQGQKVISLIDTRAIHNFIDSQLVAKRGL